MFVGDKQGMRNNIKKELKKVASSRDNSQIMYISGLSGPKDTSSESEKECSKIISMVESSSGDEDDSMDILEPSSQGKVSNRMGGANLHYEKNDLSRTKIDNQIQSSFSKSSTEQSPVQIQIKIMPNEDEFMSSSDESEDDMFADVFSNPKDIENLDKILENAKHNTSSEPFESSVTKELNKSLTKDTNLTSSSNCFTPQTSKQVSFLQNAKSLAENNKMHDVYSQIVKQSQSNSRRTSLDSDEDNHDNNIGAEIVDSMKSSKQIWLQKASEWAEKKVVPPSHRDSSNSEEKVTKAFLATDVLSNSKSKSDSFSEWERKQLVNEMKQNERENRLLSIKNQSLKTKALNDVPDNSSIEKVLLDER